MVKDNKKSYKKTASSTPKSLNFKNKILKIWNNKINQLLIKFVGLIILFYILWASRFFQEGVVIPLSKFYAQISGSILQAVGYSVKVVEESLATDSFAISIENGCDGIEGLAIFWIGVIIFPTAKKDKFYALLIGTLFLMFLNLFRIISLYWFKVHIPSLFELMHVSVWQVLFISLTLFTLLFWMDWTNKKKHINEQSITN